MKKTFLFQERKILFVSCQQTASVSSFSGSHVLSFIQNSYHWAQFWKGGLWLKVLSHPHWTWKATRNSPCLLHFSGTRIDTFPLVCPQIWIWLSKQMSAAEAAGCRTVFVEMERACVLWKDIIPFHWFILIIFYLFWICLEMHKNHCLK